MVGLALRTMWTPSKRAAVEKGGDGTHNVDMQATFIQTMGIEF